jgi:2-C-methyl-D-erythritol 4-phosphate cytidylyltransferase
MLWFTIITAGGIGLRMKSDVPKQFLELQKIPILMHTVKAFRNFDSEMEIILVLPEEHILLWKNLCRKHRFEINHKIVIGGKSRFESVRNGIESIKEEGIIAVHDGVRPLVSKETIRICFETAIEKGNAIPVSDITDSVRFISENGSKPIDRNLLKTVATPQVFRSEILRKAYSQKESPEFTDCASAAEKLGYKINLIPNNRENIKITSPSDLIIAETLLNFVR